MTVDELVMTATIHADRKTAWRTMLDDATYRIWTKEIHEGSHYTGSWEQGSEIRFIGLDENGKAQGLYGRIQKNEPFQFVSIQYLGVIENDEIDVASEAAQMWQTSTESYTFEETKGVTTLTVKLTVPSEYKEMLRDMWAPALKMLKSLCEGDLSTRSKS